MSQEYLLQKLPLYEVLIAVPVSALTECHGGVALLTGFPDFHF